MKEQWLHQLKEQIVSKGLVVQGDKIILGLSGGVDSIALLLVLIDLKKSIDMEVIPIHIHHGIREDADQDVVLCQQLCDTYGLELHVEYVDIPSLAKGLKQSEEEVARNARYKVFDAYLKEFGGTKIAVAHHMDDQAETILHRFLRGSGSLGLIGMLEVNGLIIRPLLECSKAELLEFVIGEGKEFVVDSTNIDTKYTRNKIRHELIPFLEKEYNQNIVQSLNRLSHIIREDEDFLGAESEKYFQQIILVKKECSIELDIMKLISCHIAIQRRVLRLALESLKGDLKNIEFTHITRIVELVQGQSGRWVPVSGKIVAKREFDKLIIKLDSSSNKNPIGFTRSLDTLPIKGYIQNTNFEFSVRQLSLTKYKELIKYKDSFKISKNVYTKWFDYDKIKANLVLRSREPGDFFCIHKDGGTKTIKKYFIDQKIPESLRDEIPLLADGKEIIWIVGYRINPMYTVSAETINIIEVELLKEDKNGKY